MSTEEKPSLVSNILAIIGFIILIVVVIWGLIHLASLSRGWFSSLFPNSSNTSITVMAPTAATSGVPFTVSWKYTTAQSGAYAFLYQCRSGFQFQAPGANGASNGIPCGAALTMPSTNTSIVVTPLLSGDSSLAVPISIIFMPSSTSTPQAQGSATVTVAPAANATTQENTPAPTTPAQTPAVTTTQKTVSRPAAKVAGPADLAVYIVSITTDPSGLTAATFDIGNVGGSTSGSYIFTANLPTQMGYLYTSPLQASLAPGAHILNTLRFSQEQNGIFSVTVDPSYSVRDANRGNNYASQPVNAPYQNYLPTTGQTGNYYNSYNYNYGYYPSNYLQSAAGAYPYSYYQQPSPYVGGYGGTPYTTYQYIPGQGYTNVYGQYPQYPYTY